MEIHNSEHEHFIEVHADRTVSRRGVGGSKACEGVTCGFSDATDKDEKERKASTRKLLIAVALCIVFMTVEVVGGIKANSLSILTDAAHLLSDVAAFAISLFSIWASGWEANSRQSYGFYRIEILGALVSIQMIWLLAGILVYEAINRLIHGTAEVQGFLMFLVSAFGLVVNIIMAVLLGHDHGHGHGHDHGSHEHGHDHEAHEHEAHIEGHGKDGESEKHEHTDNHGVSVTRHHHHDHSKEHAKHDVHHHGHESDVQVQLLKSYYDSEHESHSGGQQKKQRNINVQGAYLHVLGDSIQSIGVMIGGAIIWAKPQWKIVDLICTLIFSVIVLVTTITMCRNIIEVLMESTPREIDPRRLEKGLCEIDDVVAIHELHIWAITVGKVLLACHVKIRPEADADMVLDKVIDYIRTEYNISHVTIQIERE